MQPLLALALPEEPPEPKPKRARKTQPIGEPAPELGLTWAVKFRVPVAEASAAGLPASQVAAHAEPTPPERDAFATWLLKQDKRRGWIADLAKAAKADARFPRHGDPETVRKRFAALGADPEIHEALDDAELAWLA